MSSLLDLCVRCALPVRGFAAGDVLIEEGRRTGALYVLREGRVEVRKEDVELTEVSLPGAVFGEVSVLLGVPPMATVRALVDGSCFVAEDARSLLAHHPEFYEPIACLLASRLTSVSAYLVDVKRQYASREDHLGMVDEVLETLLHHQARKPVPAGPVAGNP
jgi:CRP-like cAMP-binding protein